LAVASRAEAACIAQINQQQHLSTETQSCKNSFLKPNPGSFIGFLHFIRFWVIWVKSVFVKRLNLMDCGISMS